MRTQIGVIAISLLLATAGHCAEQPSATPDVSVEPKLRAIIAAPGATPAERSIAEARRLIERLPQRADGWNTLAMAYARRARESADPEWYVKAEGALARSETIEPDNYETQKARIWVYLGKHEFSRARVLAHALNARMPDDVMSYGLLADAHVELGDYEAAERAVQWMLDLRPGNVPALTRAAYLREIFGDVEGAAELMQSAYQRVNPAEAEERAWIASHLSHLALLRGRHDEAMTLAQHALELFPRYHYALAQKGKTQLAQRQFDAAISSMRELYAAAPHPENLYLLAQALGKAGRAEQARKLFVEFEVKARAEMRSPDNSNRELTFYYVDEARQPSRALEVARLEAARRADVFTLDALAWALSASGAHVQARSTIERVLAVGFREAGVLYRAGIIALRSADRRAAEQNLLRSLEADPRSEYAERVHATLARLRAGTGPSARVAVR